MSTGERAGEIPRMSSPSLREIWQQPYGHQAEDSVTRFLMRFANSLCLPFLDEIHGDWRILAGDADPYIVVLNHSMRIEAVAVPGLLYHLRQGKSIHFLADWNFMLMPFVASLYRHAQVIVVAKKKIKPAFLGVFKSLYEHERSPAERAARKLRDGYPVGIFPEGTMNRDSKKMMRGMPGAAKLSLETGVPVIPVGIRFPKKDAARPISDLDRFSLHIGAPLDVPRITGSPSRSLVLDFHARMMGKLAELSGKSWHPRANKRRKYVS